MRALLIAACAMSVWQSTTLAADKPVSVPAYTDPTMTDADFALQGEYLGYQRPQLSPRSSELVGLQVMAVGDGKFEAVKFIGGLPGTTAWKKERITLKGERNGDLVRLIGDNYNAQIDADGVTLLNKKGEVAGHLRKEHRSSPTMGAAPPPGAVVLFDGKGTSRWKDAKVTPDGNLMAGAETVDSFGDFRLHGEFRLPYKPLGRGQDRGNSGFYLQNRYEVQVLDSFGLVGIENECGALYRIQRPELNMCLPPLEWQTYDIDLTMPRFDAEGKKIQNMRISVWQNGVPIHLLREIPSKTGAGQPEGPNPLPIKLQEHGNPVVYRNIWILPKTAETQNVSWLNIPGPLPPVPLFVPEPPCCQ